MLRFQKTLATGLLALLSLGRTALAYDSNSLPVAPPRTPPVSDFAIMAWGDTPKESQQLQWMKEAGFNITGFCHTTELAAVAIAGLKCFVDDARVNGYCWRALQ